MRDLTLREIEILLSALRIATLQRCLSHSHVHAHSLLCRGNVAAQSQSLGALLLAHVIQAVTHRVSPARELNHLLLQLRHLIRICR